MRSLSVACCRVSTVLLQAELLVSPARLVLDGSMVCLKHTGRAVFTPGSIPDRPFREFDDNSTKFAPAPTGPLSAPSAIQMQMTGLHAAQLDWTDAAESEWGRIVEKSVHGGAFQISDGTPSGVTTPTVSVDAGVADIMRRVSVYNAFNDATAATPVDLLTPDIWRFPIFGGVDPELDDPSGQRGYDADGDGQGTRLEYAFGTDPLLASPVAKPVGSVATKGAAQFVRAEIEEPQ